MHSNSDLLDGLYRLRVRTRRPLAECGIAWAVGLLENGHDSPNLEILAGLSPAGSSAEREGYLRASIQDLGLRPPGDLEQRLREARALAAAALEGEIDVIDAVARIHEVANGPLNHPPSLQPWCDLDGGFITDDDGKVTMLSGDSLASAALELASRFVAGDLGAQLVQLRSYVANESA